MILMLDYDIKRPNVLIKRLNTYVASSKSVNMNIQPIEIFIYFSRKYGVVWETQQGFGKVKKSLSYAAVSCEPNVPGWETIPACLEAHGCQVQNSRNVTTTHLPFHRWGEWGFDWHAVHQTVFLPRQDLGHQPRQPRIPGRRQNSSPWRSGHRLLAHLSGLLDITHFLLTSQVVYFHHFPKITPFRLQYFLVVTFYEYKGVVSNSINMM